MKAENEILTNGLNLIVEGISFGDGLSDSLPELVQKYNNNLPLLLTVNDRSLPNVDKPFTFEGDLHTLGQFVSDSIITNSAELRDIWIKQDGSVDGNLTVNGDFSLQGSASIGGNLDIEGSLSLQDLKVRREITVNSISASNEENLINLKGSRLINSFQNPTQAYELTNKQYVDQRLQGMTFFMSCRVTDTPDPLSDREDVSEEKDMEDNYLGNLYGSVRTEEHSGNTLYIDGKFVEQGDRVLITSYRGNLAYRNGIYIVQDVGSISPEVDWVLERASDFQVAETMNQSDLVFVREGTERLVYWFLKETPFQPEEVFSRSIHFTPYRANISLFTGSEVDIDQRLQTFENEFFEEISRLENAVARSQETILPTQLEMPIGSIIYNLSGDLDVQDTTILKLDGSQYLQAEYPELYDLIGDQYNQAEDVDGKFRVPDLRGRVLLSSSEDYPLGRTGGKETNKLRLSQLPDSNITIYSQSHNHDLEVWKEDPEGDTDISNIDSSAPMVSDYWEDHLSPNGRSFVKDIIQNKGADSKLSSSTLGSKSPIDNLPPYFACHPYVKAKRSLVTQELPKVTWLSFSDEFISYNRSASNRSVEIFVELDLFDLPQSFLDRIKLEIINETTDTVLHKVIGLDTSYGNDSQNKKSILIQNLEPGDNFLSVRLSEPTIPNDVWSTSIRYRRRVPETSSISTQDRIDRNCPFKILSAYTTPLEVSSGDTITYRTQAEGVYHIQTTLYYFPTNSTETEVYSGVITGDIESPACRQLLLIGTWVVPSIAVSGDTIGVEFKYWSPTNPSNDPHRIETLYLDVV